MTVRHAVLLRQLKRLKLSEDQIPTLAQWQGILEQIDDSYNDADESRYLNERSINISSREMTEKNQELLAIISKLRNVQQDLIQAEKMATIGQLSAGIAHEINNPLSYALSNIGVLQKRLPILLQLLDFYQNPNHNLPLPEIINQINVPSILADLLPLVVETKEGLIRIKDIVENLNQFTRTRKETNILIDLNTILESAIKIMHNKLKYKCNLQVNLGELPKILGNPTELSVAFINLLMNAEQSIKDKGNIIITSKVSYSDILISITDNGCGIAPENLTKIFTPFFSTRPIGTGIGLGLSTAYGIIKLHNGTIKVESKEGVGSTFTIYLPINYSTSEA